MIYMFLEMPSPRLPPPEDPSLIPQVFTKLTIKITHSYGIIPYARQAVDRIDPRLCPCQILEGLNLTVKKQ